MRTVHAFERGDIAELYRWFASEAEPTSPVWAVLCRWIAEHPEVSGRLDALPGIKRQPNVFLGALKYLGGPLEPGPDFARWVAAHWDALERVILVRSTQTNEPGRCAVLAPVLAALPQPITLLELGSSAGACLVPDRYRYRFSDAASPPLGGPDGPGQVGAPDAVRPDGTPGVSAPDAARPDAPTLDCAVAGTPPGEVGALRVAARAGLDLNPLDASHPEDARWLRALVWPGEDAREARLAACLGVVAQDPPPIISGDLRRDLDRLFALVAPGSTPVLQHSAVLSYLPRADRDAFESTMLASGVRWLSYEGPTVLSGVRERLRDQERWATRPHFVVALDGVPIGRASAHGAWVEWG